MLEMLSKFVPTRKGQSIFVHNKLVLSFKVLNPIKKNLDNPFEISMDINLLLNKFAEFEVNFESRNQSLF